MGESEDLGEELAEIANIFNSFKKYLFPKEKDVLEGNIKELEEKLKIIEELDKLKQKETDLKKKLGLNGETKS